MTFSSDDELAFERLLFNIFALKDQKNPLFKALVHQMYHDNIESLVQITASECDSSEHIDKEQWLPTPNGVKTHSQVWKAYAHFGAHSKTTTSLWDILHVTPLEYKEFPCTTFIT